MEKWFTSAAQHHFFYSIIYMPKSLDKYSSLYLNSLMWIENQLNFKGCIIFEINKTNVYVLVFHGLTHANRTYTATRETTKKNNNNNKPSHDSLFKNQNQWTWIFCMYALHSSSTNVHYIMCLCWLIQLDCRISVSVSSMDCCIYSMLA